MTDSVDPYLREIFSYQLSVISYQLSVGKSSVIRCEFLSVQY